MNTNRSPEPQISIHQTSVYNIRYMSSPTSLAQVKTEDNKKYSENRLKNFYWFI
jgi:hypothetical protein